MTTPHLVLSRAVSHRLSGDLDSPHRPCQRPQTYRGPSTAERPAAPGRGPSWLQATCSRRASGRGGGCGRGSSGTPAWQGEASIRKETKPLAQLEGPSPFPGILRQPSRPESRAWGGRGAPKPRPQPIRGNIHHRYTPSGEKRPALSLGDSPKCPLLALRTCGMRGGEVGVVGRRVLSLGSHRCVRRGKGRTRCEWTVPAGGQRGARYPHPHLWAGGPGTRR